MLNTTSNIKMLQGKECSGAKMLLQLLKTDDLLSLANTITNKRVVVQTRAGKLVMFMLNLTGLNYFRHFPSNLP